MSILALLQWVEGCPLADLAGVLPCTPMHPCSRTARRHPQPPSLLALADAETTFARHALFCTRRAARTLVHTDLCNNFFRDYSKVAYNARQVARLGRSHVSTAFDVGYGKQPFRSLVEDVPDASVFPHKDFRTEWGPVFHRGRLDGSARVLVIAQDPAQHEIIARRTLVGGAGHRVQGFLAKLGLTRSYVMLNTYVYSVFGQGGGNKHKKNAAIAAYRNRWFDAILPKKIEGVVAFGQLADLAWQQWRATPRGGSFNGVFCPVTHPTQPESSSKGDKTKHAAAVKKMLQGWNTALAALSPVVTPDVVVPFVPYGAAFLPTELPDIFIEDLPAGSPPWMCGNADWARRTGTSPELKRVTITVTIPKTFRPS